ncbi:MAG: glycosyltransferase family 4 protein [Acidimicrobiales bacterium]
MPGHTPATTTMNHLLVTNDFPPKVGGIQSYLWELWRRLPPEQVTVLTTPYPGDESFDRAQRFRIERDRQRVLVPTPALVRRIDALAEEVGASLVVLDPALPLGLLGRRLQRPYVVLLHGAELTVPGRLPGSRELLRGVLRGAAHVVSGGNYVGREAEKVAGCALPQTLVPPGVDAARFRPLDARGREEARASFGLPVEGRLVLGLSRLVPRKGLDVLVRAATLLAPSRPDLMVAIGGSGRQAGYLGRAVAKSGAPVRLLGRVAESSLPLLFGAADVFVMPCRNRWGGLEQEGFGIVFLEAASAAVPSVAGESGGATEAVADNRTGLVVRHPRDPTAVAAAVGRLLDDADLRRRMGLEGRRRAVAEFGYDHLARRLADALAMATAG